MARLFEIGAELQALADMLDACEGADEFFVLDFAIDAQRERLRADEAAEVARLAAWELQLKMEEEAAAAQEKLFKAKKEARAKRREWIKERVLRPHLEATRRAKIEAGDRLVSIQKNGGRPPITLSAGVSLEQIARDHPQCVRVRHELNADAVREAIQAGQSIEGVSLGEVGSHVRIR